MGGFMFKKILSLLLISFLLVSAGTFTKTYKFNRAPVVKEGYVYLEGCRPSMQGFAPAVAARGCKIGLAPGLQAKNVTVAYKNLVQVAGDFYIKPTVPAFKSTGRTLNLNSENIYKDAAARELLARYYEKDALYPGVQESYPAVTQFKYGVGVAIFTVYPVQYNPVRGELFYYKEVTVSVETEAVDPAREVAGYVMTPFHRSMLQFTIDNPEMLADLELTPMDENDYEVLLITYSSIQTAWNEYIALNKRRGLRTKLALITDVLQTSGPTDQDKIRNYIKNEYTNSKIIFATLGGDVNRIRHRELYSESYDHNQTPDRFMQKYSGADMYYGTLDGNWNNDGDNKYGEVGEEDMLWEVYVARMPADNNSHVSAMVGKTKHYVETPQAAQVTNVLMAGEFLWDDYGKSIWGIDNMEYYVGHKNAYGWETYGWPEPPFNISRISDKETGAANGWNSSDLRAKLLSTKPTWIDHDGHANSTYCMAMGSSSIPGCFTNTGSTQNYFVLVSGGCNPGQFSVSDCWMETILFLNERGAVANISNWDSGIGDDDDNNSPSGVPTRHGHDAMFNPAKRVPFLEAAHAVGKEALIDVSLDPNAINIAPYYGLMRYTSYNTNTLGDPALNVWTGPVKTLTQPFPHTASGSAFTMTTPPYTCILLANPTTDDIITAQITGYQYSGGANFVVGDSTCSITDAGYTAFAASNNKVKAYIKAPNYLPAVFEIDITSAISNTIADEIYQFSVKPVKGKLLVNFALPVDEHVNVSLFNSKGVLVKTLVNGYQKAGNHHVDMSSSDVSNGIYYCKVKTKNAQNVKSFVITK
jgi:hypothetical protein